MIMALLGYLGLVTGLLLNEASALFVIVNALRLLKWQSTGIPVLAQQTAAQQVRTQMDEQRAAVASPFATVEASCCCGEPTRGVSLPTLVINEAKGACCGASKEPTTEVSFPIFPMAAAQGSRCAAPDVTEQGFAPTNDITKTRGSDGVNSVVFRIDGMACSCEGQMVEKRVKSLTGVKSFTLNPITNQMKLTYDQSAVSIKDIEAAVKKAGAKAVLMTSR